MSAASVVDLVVRACRGETEAFDSLIEVFGRDLRVFVASRAVDRDQLEEVCQATWVTAWERLADWRREAPFDSWLRGIARNIVLQHLTRHARERARGGQDLLEQAIAADGLAHLDEADDPLFERLPLCLEQIAPRARAMLIARHCSGESLASLARRFKQPAAGLATTLWRIRSAIRRCLEAPPQ